MRGPAILGNPLRPVLRLDFSRPESVFDPRIQFSRASPSSYINSSLAMATAPANTPVRNFDPVTGQFLGWRMEGERYNYLSGSETLATQTVTMSPLPFGGEHRFLLSWYGTGSVAVDGNLYGGTTSGTGSGAFPTRSSFYFTILSSNLPQNITVTVSGQVKYANLEWIDTAPVSGWLQPSSWIPTPDGPAARAADSAYINLSDFGHRQGGGTSLIKASLFKAHGVSGDSRAAIMFAFTASDDNLDSSITLHIGSFGSSSSNPSVWRDVRVAGSTQYGASKTSAAWMLNDEARFGVAFGPASSVSIRKAASGTAAYSNTVSNGDGSIPTVNKLRLGGARASLGGSNAVYAPMVPMFGHITRFLHFDRQLSPEQLQDAAEYLI